MRRNTPWERPTRREDLAGWYAAMLDRQSESGMSVTDFAASAGVSAWTLYQWRRRLAEDDGGREAAPRLVEVAVLPSAAPATARAAASLSVELRSGHRLEVQAGFDGNELRRLIKVLESC